MKNTLKDIIHRTLVILPFLCVTYSMGFSSGKKYEDKRHKDDYLKINISRDLGSEREHDCSVEMKFADERIYVPRLVQILKTGGLDKEIQNENIQSSLEDAYSPIKRLISGYTHGFQGNDMPSKIINWDIIPQYGKWDDGEYGNEGYVAGIILKPNK